MSTLRNRGRRSKLYLT